MNKYLANLKKNAFYSLMVGMIISLPFTLMVSTYSDSDVCYEEDYAGDKEECLRIAKNFKTHGWIFLLFPLVMAIASGMFHFFPGDFKLIPAEQAEEKGVISVGTIMSFIGSAIAVMFILQAGTLLSDEDFERYSYFISAIPFAVFVIGYRTFNDRWFWQDKKKPL